MIEHPWKDENGNTIIIREPHTPSSEDTWLDPNAVATFVPGSPYPSSFDVEPNIFGIYEKEPPYIGIPDKDKAAGIVIVMPDKRVVVISPTNKFSGYRYTFPKGGVEEGHTIYETAVKETVEETGIVAFPYMHLGDYERPRSLSRMYIGNYVGGNPSSMGWETQATHLIPMHRLYEFLHTDVDRMIVRDLLRKLAK